MGRLYWVFLDELGVELERWNSDGPTPSVGELVKLRRDDHGRSSAITCIRHSFEGAPDGGRYVVTTCVVTQVDTPKALL